MRWQGLELLNLINLQKMNKEQNVEGLNVSPAIAKPMLPAGWLSLDAIPPDELVQVIDAEGNTAHAYPTWYPFKVVQNPNKVGKWTSDVVPCEPYWDGGWMVACEGLTSNIGTVIGWRSVQPACR